MDRELTVFVIVTWMTYSHGSERKSEGSETAWAQCTATRPSTVSRRSRINRTESLKRLAR